MQSLKASSFPQFLPSILHCGSHGRESLTLSGGGELRTGGGGGGGGLCPIHSRTTRETSSLIGCGHLGCGTGSGGLRSCGCHT